MRIRISNMFLLAAVFSVLAPLSSAPAQDPLLHCGNPTGLKGNVTNIPLREGDLGPLRAAVPFVATTSGPVEYIHWWRRWHSDGLGYSSGNGGIINIEIQTDKDGEPSGQTVGLPIIYLPELDILNPNDQMETTYFDALDLPQVIKGRTYWIIFENTGYTQDGIEGLHWISLNGPLLENWNSNATPPQHIWGEGHGLDIARPCDNLYLHSMGANQGAGGNSGENWAPHRSFPHDPRFTHFPYVVAFVNGVAHGNPFRHGPPQSRFPWTVLVDEDAPEKGSVPGPRVTVGNGVRVRQLATFKECRLDEKVRLHFFAQDIDATGDDPSYEGPFVDVYLNGNLQGQVQVSSSEYQWHSIDLNTQILPMTQSYEFEFRVEEAGARVLISTGATVESSFSGFDYIGHAEVYGLANAAHPNPNEWKPFPAGHTTFDYGGNVQLAFYLTGNALPLDSVDAFVSESGDLRTLIINGTEDDDEIQVRSTGVPGQVDLAVVGSNTITFDNITNVCVSGRGGHDDIAVDFAGTAPNEILGGPGNDILNGGVGVDRIEGNNGADVMYGDDGDDELSGGGGDDILYGGIGDDLCAGGAGHDTIFGGTNRDTLFGGSGDDVLWGEGGNDIIRGGDDNDSVYGGAGIDSIFGDSGDDILRGNGGDDFFTGGDGFDEFFGGAGFDTALDAGEVESSIESS